jgi:hypothetical protein
LKSGENGSEVNLPQDFDGIGRSSAILETIL